MRKISLMYFISLITLVSCNGGNINKLPSVKEIVELYVPANIETSYMFFNNSRSYLDIISEDKESEVRMKIYVNERGREIKFIGEVKNVELNEGNVEIKLVSNKPNKLEIIIKE